MPAIECSVCGRQFDGQKNKRVRGGDMCPSCREQWCAGKAASTAAALSRRSRLAWLVSSRREVLLLSAGAFILVGATILTLHLASPGILLSERRGCRELTAEEKRYMRDAEEAWRILDMKPPVHIEAHRYAGAFGVRWGHPTYLGTGIVLAAVGLFLAMAGCLARNKESA